MAVIKRIFLFGLVNVLVVTTIGVLLSVSGFNHWLEQQGVPYLGLLVFCSIFGFGGAFVSLILSKWMVKRSMGVHVIDPKNPGGADERWLVDTVRRLAGKAGIGMPEVGIYESPDPNAFATGATKDNALVAVSTGLYRNMSKDEVEGVLGHEIAHAANGDMVTMALVQGVINTLVFFLAHVISMAIANAMSGGRRGGWFLKHMIFMAVQIPLSFLGLIPLFAFSRWREFRADAGGASLAGRPKMMAALQALQGLKPVKVEGEPESLAAFKISNPGGSLFSSHPPLAERIKRLQKAQLPSVISE